MSFLLVIIVPFFIIALYVHQKFEWGSESKDDRGKKIRSEAANKAIPIFPIGWLLIELYNDYIEVVSFELYRDYIAILALLTLTVVGLSIWFLKQKY
ncbi:hypothetical protein ACKXGF_03350 [Alkalibacillus sp. S2W]|uniref:hypothetical protein n=1 Tax=Alkalibacillus sp. S2W TaxID=3386553 RepID=UPI00398CE1BC